MPLRVQVFAKGSADPAFEVGFTSVDFGRPDAAQFAFNPPPGTKVTERDAALRTPATAARKPGTGRGRRQARRVVGHRLGHRRRRHRCRSRRAGAGTERRGRLEGRCSTLLPKVSGTWGSGHLLEGTLFSAVLTDDGRVAVGA